MYYVDYHFIATAWGGIRNFADVRPLLNYGLILADPLSKFCTTCYMNLNSQHFSQSSTYCLNYVWLPSWNCCNFHCWDYLKRKPTKLLFFWLIVNNHTRGNKLFSAYYIKYILWGRDTLCNLIKFELSQTSCFEVCDTVYNNSFAYFLTHQKVFLSAVKICVYIIITKCGVDHDPSREWVAIYAAHERCSLFWKSSVSLMQTNRHCPTQIV
jgi:hypothetical protein